MTDATATTPGLIDSHCHISSRELTGAREALLARAVAAGVRAVVDIATDPAQGQAVVAAAESWQGSPAIYAGVGLHPHEARYWRPEMIGELRALAQSPKVVVIGEMGLDYHHVLEPAVQALQADSFRAQMALAAELDKPFVVHSRDAARDTLELLTAEKTRRGRPLKGIMHCFTGDTAFALDCVALGMYISFSGIVTYKNAGEIQAAAKAVPAAKILVETDAPYLSPEPLRGNKYYPNEPARVTHTAQFIARLRGEPYADFAARVTATTAELLGIRL